MTTRFSVRNDAGPTMGNTAALSLWQKFSQLQQLIAECHKERKEIETKIDASQMRQSDLRELRRENLRESREADRKLNETEEKMVLLQKQYHDEIQPAYASALLGKRSREIKLSQWKEYKASALQLFLDRSAKFRSNCKQLQITSEALGLGRAQIQSWMYVNECDQGDESPGMDFDQSNERVHQIRSSEDDPFLWNISQGDYELLELLEEYKRTLSDYEIFHKDLDVLKSRKKECLERESTLRERATLMQKQLNRILKDCDDLESQMTGQYTSKLARGQTSVVSTCSLQQHQDSSEKQAAAPKRARKNPYLQNRTSISSHSASKRKKTLQSIVFGSTAFPSSASSKHRSSRGWDECEVDCQEILDDNKQTESAGRGTSDEHAHFPTYGKIDDDEDEDDLFSFVGLRK